MQTLQKRVKNVQNPAVNDQKQKQIPEKDPGCLER